MRQFNLFLAKKKFKTVKIGLMLMIQTQLWFMIAPELGIKSL